MNPVRKTAAVILLSCGMYFTVYGQNVGINATGATPNASAMLDISDANKGLLIPRVALTATNAAGPITSPATSLLVYNTATAGVVPDNVIPGYYYWNGTAWIAFHTTAAASTAWVLDGNTGVTSSNFLGTADDRVMTFRSNNQPFLEFGNRGTLGLTQGFTDYTDATEKVTHIRSALQFEAPAASFYKPKMWTDTDGNFRVKGASAGTDYFEFGATGSANAGGFEFVIGDDGDEPILFKSYHYINGYSEIMRLQSGRMSVGSNAFDATNPEKLLIDAGTTSSYNLMTGKGSIDNYLQINVKNQSAGGSASSDVVASSNNGTESVNYIDMGINSSGYSNTSLPVLGGANTAYLYSTGADFVIGNATESRPLRFFTGGTANANERMRIDGNGRVGIANLAPAEALDVTGNMRFSGALMPNGAAGTAGNILQSNGTGVAPTWVTSASVASGTNWVLDGNAVAANRNFGTTTNFSLPFITNSIERMRISNTGNVAVGTSTFNGTFPEKFLVDAGTTTSVNAIVGKGSINNYLQLNIQNTNAGTNASSDVVATANNGTETTNYIDMGINSSVNTSGVMGVANDAYLYNMGQNLLVGTGTANKSLVFMTGGTTQSTNERMRIDGDGYVMIGTNTNDGEKLLVDAGSGQTAISAIGSINDYMEINVQNSNNGNFASSDIVATANNGTDNSVYVDLGINSQGYSNSNSNILNGPNLAYLYASGRDFKIGNGSPNYDLVFFTNPLGGTQGDKTANGVERMRIDGGGNVGIGQATPTEILDVNGNFKLTGAFMPNNTAGTSGYVLTSAGAGASPTWSNPTTLLSTSAWILDGNGVGAMRNFGTTSNFSLPFITNNTEKMRLLNTGGLAIGTTSLDATNPEKLLVDAGTTTSFNVISGKGSINNYLQLNIQNRSTGTAASSDIVASANNATESINFVDLGINSSGYSAAGVLGGANNGYLYSTGNDFVIGNATANRNLEFFTGGTATTNERMRIDGNGNVAIGTTTFDATNPEKFLVNTGTTTSENAIVARGSINSYLQLNIQNQSSGTNASADVVATADNGSETTNYVDMGINSSTNTSTIMGGPNDAYLYNLGQNLLIGAGTASKSVIFLAGGQSQSANERMRITSNGMTMKGSMTMPYRVGTGAYTVLATDYVVINTGGAATWTLPDPTTCAGRVYRLINQGTGTITSSRTIRTGNGSTVTTIATAITPTRYEIISDGTEWRSID